MILYINYWSAFMMTELTTKIKMKEDRPELWGDSIPITHGDNGSISKEDAEANLKSAITQEEILAAIDALNEPRMMTLEAENTVMDMLQEKEEFVDAAMEKTAEIIDEPFRPRNRAERRALDKATRRQKQKKRRMFADSIKETAEKLAYINMIEKVRALNEQIKAEGEKENEAAN